MKKCLNLGAGLSIKQSSLEEKWINLDKYDNPGIDIVYDLDKLPWKPLKDNEFDKILVDNTLEHLKPDTMDLMKELLRITKDSGEIIIIVPHHTNSGFYNEHHHKMFWWRSFEYRLGRGSYDLENEAAFKNLRLEKRKILFHKGILFYNYIIEIFVNLHRTIQMLYENTFLKYLFPANEIYFKLRVKKQRGI